MRESIELLHKSIENSRNNSHRFAIPLMAEQIYAIKWVLGDYDGVPCKCNYAPHHKHIDEN